MSVADFPMRLDKFLAHAADMSRELSRRAIKAKRVTVNGELVRSASRAISASDEVLLDQQRMSIPGPSYYMLHKPAGYVCATIDSDHPTVLDLLAHEVRERALGGRLAIAGRLDKDTTGLVLLSDDGQWLHAVTSPRRQCIKTYHARLDGAVTPEVVQQFEQGLFLRNDVKATRPATLRPLDDGRAEVCISEGRYHQVKRMFAACGLHVQTLHRVSIGAVTLDEALAPGEYRPLSADEIAGAIA